MPIRTKPLVGYIGLSRMPGWRGRVVRGAQWLNGDGFADYEHSFICVGDDKIVQAMPGGAELVTNTHDPETTMYFAPMLGHATRVVIAHEAVQLVDTPYSYLDYGSLALHRMHIRPQWVQDYITSTDHMICSQLVDAAYHRAGVNLFDDGRFPSDVTPGDLYLLSQKLQRRQETQDAVYKAAGLSRRVAA